MLKYHNKVMLDTPPYNTEYLDDILSAIDKQYLLKFKYVSGFGAESDIVLQPAFVRYFKRRWYVVGVKKQRSASEGKANSSAEVDGDVDLNAATDEKKLVRCLPFDRISFLKLICEKHPCRRWDSRPEQYPCARYTWNTSRSNLRFFLSLP